MSSQPTPLPTTSFPRVLGVHDSGMPGPTLLALGGIHGNEPGGVLALQRVLNKLAETQLPLRGRLIALAGNLKALETGQRYIHRDLNRQWLPDRIYKLRTQDKVEDWQEDTEQRELLAQFDDAVKNSHGHIVFLDLHSSSGGGPPFVCIGDTRSNRKIAQRIPIPMVLGLEECIDGGVLEYFSQKGLVCLAVEGGTLGDPQTVDNLEAATWLAMSAAGILPEDSVNLQPYRDTLTRTARSLPRVVEVRYRHVLELHENFTMEPGFQSFDRVKKGQLLARNREGPLVSSLRGHILLPLYQGQGLDGYFLARPVRTIWLKIASAMRFLKLDHLVRWFPGIARHPDDPHSLVVNPKVARWFVVEIFHLLGFRKRRPVGEKLVFTRRWTAPEGRRLGE